MSERNGNDPPLVEIHGLTRTFETGGGPIDVLKGLDLEIAAGDLIAIVGQSGVGKSTLLHILGTLDHPTSGGVLELLKPRARSSVRLRNRCR